jgi:hypothetical protein
MRTAEAVSRCRRAAEKHSVATPCNALRLMPQRLCTDYVLFRMCSLYIECVLYI